jgi:hypothetical protein
MARKDVDEVASAWIAATPVERSGEGRGAAQRAAALARQGSPEGWAVVRSLIALARDESTLAAISAGPLRDFVNGSGDSFVDELAMEAGDDERFAAALRSVEYAGPSEAVRRLIEELRADHAFRSEPEWPESCLWEAASSPSEKEARVREELERRGAPAWKPPISGPPKRRR